jgi:hypothetical protein
MTSLILHRSVTAGKEVMDLIREVLLFIICMEASIMHFSSLSVVLAFTSYTRDFIYPQR